MDNRIIINSAKTIYGNGHTISGSQLTGIFAIAGGMNVVINNVILKDSSAVNGGAITAYVNVNGLTFNNVKFLNNHASDSGGAVFIDANDLAIATRFKNCHFEDNVAEKLFGGAVYTNTIRGNVEYVIFKNNQAKTDDGGAIYIDDEYDSKFAHCIFESNYARARGGAICVNDINSDVTLTRNAFINNIATYGKSGYTANRRSITDLWSDEAFILGPNWYGNTSEKSRQGQFYKSTILPMVSSDSVEFPVNSWLDSMWEIFDD